MDPKKPRDIDPIDPDADDLRGQLAELQAQMQAVLALKSSSGAISEEALERMFVRVAQVSADAQERAANPSNRSHPGRSVYSYPEGDRERPRALKCQMFWVGYDLATDTTTALELELLNRAEPGTFTFLRTDGSPETLTVRADRAPGGSIDRLHFDFPVKERRESLPSMTAMLQSAFGIKTQEQLELDRLRAELEVLRAGALVTA